MQKTKIIATIGPATLDYNVFHELVVAGIDYVRINTAYGDTNQYDLIVENIKKLPDHHHIPVVFDIKHEDIIDYFVEKKLEIVALSFTERSAQIERIRKRAPNAFIIAKIESKEGVKHFDEILEAADGIMIARGDLGKAETLEKVPPLQKTFTKKTLEKGKFLVTATEMLLSMTTNPQPTHAEVSDVANAVFDGTSAVMLSEETAIGKYPVETVYYMQRIIAEAERWRDNHHYKQTEDV
ncbi:MAG: pyruvate kinase [Patescibacteria group bacterium]|nr:pyruvate kinase [Patescibacteria group bacterium]